jgi:class 3 adenylate cyclase
VLFDNFVLKTKKDQGIQMRKITILDVFKNSKVESEVVSNLVLDQLDSIATKEDDELQKKLLKELVQNYVRLEKKVDSLLKNTLPETVAEEIKYEGHFSPRHYNCTILFSDFVGFTRLAEKISGKILIENLNKLFTGFDELIVQHMGTKIKTIGDAYMAVFGAPTNINDHPLMSVRAGKALLDFLDSFNQENDQEFHMRIGIHTGHVMAGVVGKERMQFDVFGDAVNIASRFESSGEKGKINVSEATYLRTKNYFEFEERGMIALKNKADLRAYFVVR